jgi:hypothetical protein
MNASEFQLPAPDFLEHDADTFFIEIQVVDEIDIIEELLPGDIIFL